MKLFFAKINLTSHITDLYNKKIELKNVLDRVIEGFNDGIEWRREEYRTINGKEIKTYEAIYVLKYIQKLGANNNFSIVGKMQKTAPLFIKKMNDATGEIYVIPEENTETILFYFDVYKETVFFDITNRFRYMEFINSFQNILNKSLEKYKYEFEVELYKNSLSIEDVKNTLRRIGNIKELKVSINLPNPNSHDLDEIIDSEESRILELKQGRISTKTTTFSSKDSMGIDIDSNIVNEEFDVVNTIHSSINAEEALSKGYATIDAKGDNGNYTTKEQKPFTVDIEDKNKNVSYFIEQGMNIIRSIFI